MVDAEPTASVTVGLCDTSSDADSIANALLEAGFAVTRVQPRRLASFLETDAPEVLVCDGAVARERSGVLDAHVPTLLLEAPSAGRPASSHTLIRPIDLEALVSRVHELCRAEAASPVEFAEPALPSAEVSAPSAGLHLPQLPASTNESAVHKKPTHAEFSAELVELLRRAEQALGTVERAPAAEEAAPIELNNTETVPEELLKMLDEPLNLAERQTAEPSRASKPPPPRNYVARDDVTPIRPLDKHPVASASPSIEAAKAAPSSTPPPSSAPVEGEELTRAEGRITSSEGLAGDSGASPHSQPARRRLRARPTAAFAQLGQAIAERFTGALAFQTTDGVRRLLLRDGDVVIVASGSRDDSLVTYLATHAKRAILQVEELSHRVPPFGRHAGAALIAAGIIEQQELWNVLRAHAEWLLERILFGESEPGIREDTVPERLAQEPAVFGGATGAETFVALSRECADPNFAWDLLTSGGSAGQTTCTLQGAHAAKLVTECALTPDEQAALQELLRHGQLDERAKGWASTLLALQALSIIGLQHARTLPAAVPSMTAEEAPEVERPAWPPPSEPASEPAATSTRGVVHLAANTPRPSASRRAATAPAAKESTPSKPALRDRVLAQKSVTEDADYFRVLGLAPDATGQEVRRAYLTLRKEFDPSRALTAATSDLTESVEQIVEVIEEAYTVLRDTQLRDQYRLAIRGS